MNDQTLYLVELRRLAMEGIHEGIIVGRIWMSPRDLLALLDTIEQQEREIRRLSEAKARTIEAWGTESCEKSQRIDEWAAEYRKAKAELAAAREYIELLVCPIHRNSAEHCYRDECNEARAALAAGKAALNCQDPWHSEAHSYQSTCPSGYRCNAPSKWFTKEQRVEWEAWRDAGKDAGKGEGWENASSEYPLSITDDTGCDV